MGSHSVTPIRRPVVDATAADRIRDATNDLRMAAESRRMAGECDRLWDAGRAAEIDHVMRLAATGDRRFRGRTERELTIIGAVRWSQSKKAQGLRNKADQYTRQAMLDLSFARVRTRIHQLSGEPVRL